MGKTMSFMALLGITYLLLIVLSVLAFRKRKKVIGIALIAIMVLGIAVLGYLWITSPM